MNQISIKTIVYHKKDGWNSFFTKNNDDVNRMSKVKSILWLTFYPFSIHFWNSVRNPKVPFRPTFDTSYFIRYTVDCSAYCISHARKVSQNVETLNWRLLSLVKWCNEIWKLKCDVIWCDLIQQMSRWRPTTRKKEKDDENKLVFF